MHGGLCEIRSTYLESCCSCTHTMLKTTIDLSGSQQVYDVCPPSSSYSRTTGGRGTMRSSESLLHSSWNARPRNYGVQVPSPPFRPLHHSSPPTACREDLRGERVTMNLVNAINDGVRIAMSTDDTVPSHSFTTLFNLVHRSAHSART